jgi:hypothetical protein
MNTRRRRWFLAVLVGFAVFSLVFILPDLLPVIILEVLPAEQGGPIAQAVNFIPAWQRNLIAIGAAVAAGGFTAWTYKERRGWPIGLATFILIFVFLFDWIFANFAPGWRSALGKLALTFEWIGSLALSWTTVSWFISQCALLAMVLTYVLAGRRLGLR